MSAVAEVEDQQLVSQPRSVTTFLARRQNLRLVKVPARPIRNATTGEEVGRTEGQVLEFDVFLDPVRMQQLIDGGMDMREAQAAARYGRKEVPTEGVMELAAGVEVDAAEVHAWLMRHKMNGDMVEGFWRLEPTAPAVSKDELAKLMEAALDEDMLEAIIEQERSGWGRVEILNAAEGALTRLRQKIAEAVAAEAQAAEKPAASRAKPKG